VRGCVCTECGCKVDFLRPYLDRIKISRSSYTYTTRWLCEECHQYYHFQQQLHYWDAPTEPELSEGGSAAPPTPPQQDFTASPGHTATASGDPARSERGAHTGEIETTRSGPLKPVAVETTCPDPGICNESSERGKAGSGPSKPAATDLDDVSLRREREGSERGQAGAGDSPPPAEPSEGEE